MNWSFFVAGLVAHLIFFYSIFDIYFTSPLLHGMTPQRSSIPAPAKRLVLFVADGLRADSFYKLDSTGQSRAPFLRNKIMNDGVWGVSHTRVPTESRPGHVALIAGFYEDVSAVAKGWKENPVEFDSVFNESRSTWSWGSPDILPMFAKGATGDHVHTFMYPAESEDFAGSDASKLDTWVFSSVEDFFERAKHDDALLEKLKQYQIVFFLHLLGIDVNGHSKKPKSQEYQENIAIVDAGIKETVQLIEDFYERDGRTSYVFTADHGMTNWGSHGASDPSETMTPFVAWGAGIRSPLPLDPSVKQEELQTEWSLETIQRSDVAQADIASLMSVLLGLPLPLQSVGTVPVQVLRSHNSEDHVFQAHALYAKARQMLQQMHVSGRHRQRTTLSWLFVLFRSLPMQLEVSMIEEIESALQAGLHERAMTVAQQLVDLAQDGLSYYHHYDRFFLGVSVTLGFAGWLGSVLELLFDKHTLLTVAGAQQHIERRRSLQPFWTSSKGIRVAFILFAAINCILLYVQSLPWTYYIYTLLPVLLWQNVIQNRQAIVDAFYYVFDHGMLLRFVKLGILAVLALEVIVISFFYRQILTVGFIAIAIWPVVEGQHLDWSAIGWVGSCLFLSVFPSLPPVGGETKYTLLCSSGLCLATLFAVGQVVAGVKPQNKENVRSFQIISIIQISICVLAVYLVWSTSASIKAGQGLPLLNQILSWGVLLVSPGLPLFTETSLYCRLQALMQAWTPIYILLSISHEGLFLGGLCALLLCWLHLENAVVYKKPVRLETLDFARGPGMLESRRKLWPSDVRMAYFYCFFLITAFFGTGNIASINSFDISSVYCFITVFSPFTMGALLLFKILIPFLLVACAFRGIHLAQNVPTQSLFLLVLLMSDFMALHFFLLVRDSGSWLEIGTSISHYVIVMALILFILLLLALSQVLTGFSLIHRTKKYKV